ncbi:MAG: hypothetical protein ACE5I7_13360 [Candidatus Binatia bacterium]
MKTAVLLAALGGAVFPSGLLAQGPAPELLPPAWLTRGDLRGKHTSVRGSKTKFLEDYNQQDGVTGHLVAHQEWSDDRSARIEALGQSGEEQGWFIGDYHRLGHYSLLLDVSGSQRFYNARTGEAPETSFGVPLAGNFFPFVNDSRFLFSNDDISIHRLNIGGTIDYVPRFLFHDVYLDFHYQRVTGQETLLKGGTVADPAADISGTGGPGTVAFDFPGRKEVDYDTLKGFVGGRSGAGGINWQTDGTYARSDVTSDVTEANFGTSLSTTELDRFREDNTVHVGKFDLVGSRFLRPNLYVYGAYLFSFERNDPEPAQFVTPSAAAPTRLTTRNTSDGDVHRLGNSLGLGLLYRPYTTVAVTIDSRARGNVQSGSISEDRNESQFLAGNIGTIRNDSDRHWVDTTTRVAASWVALPRTLVRAQARYTYRETETDSTRTFNFVQVRDPERQDYRNRFNRAEGGPSVRWRAGHGRVVEAGYTFFYEDVTTSVDELSNEYIQNDYTRQRHNAYLKGAARLRTNLRGELRFEYVREHRDLSAPLVDPVRFTLAAGGNTDWETFRVTPNVSYQPNPHWNLFGAVSVGQERLTIDDLGQVPASYRTFKDFQYDALTETIAVGTGYAPSRSFSLSTSYNFVNNGHRSVENQIHRVEVTGRYQWGKHWAVRAGFRHLRFDQDQFGTDDYRANIPFIGVSGRF